eukprot:364997-Chlamydomonas_euryale.AAC.9
MHPTNQSLKPHPSVLVYPTALFSALVYPTTHAPNHLSTQPPMHPTNQSLKPHPSERRGHTLHANVHTPVHPASCAHAPPARSVHSHSHVHALTTHATTTTLPPRLGYPPLRK